MAGEPHTVLVTGASRGIGRAICLKLARDAADGRGQAVSIAACGASHPDLLDAVVEELEGLGARAVPLLGDLADPAVPERLVSEALDAFGRLDGLVSNAGYAAPGTLLSWDTETWDRAFDVNVRATWQLGRAAHAALAERRGAIVTVGSLSGGQPHLGLGGYSASKAGLIMLTRVMAQEWAKDGIRVNCVSPGLVLTPMTETAYADQVFKESRAVMVPQRRIADPYDDIAGVAAFLLGPDARYCTGQNVIADGGLSDSILAHLPIRNV